MYFNYLLILYSLIFPSKIFAYSFDQKTSNKKSEIFYDFSKMPNYYLPHKYNTTKKAAVIENGVLKLTVKPGMRGSSDDEIMGRYRLVTEHIYPDEFVEMAKILKDKEQ